MFKAIAAVAVLATPLITAHAEPTMSPATPPHEQPRAMAPDSTTTTVAAPAGTMHHRAHTTHAKRTHRVKPKSARHHRTMKRAQRAKHKAGCHHCTTKRAQRAKHKASCHHHTTRHARTHR